ncbi:MAG: transcription termination/antitermination NusG family protein [Gammaproteobacteria bacterium]
MKHQAAWTLVQSKPRQERVALENLLRQGYEAYLPLIRTADRSIPRRTGVSPAFPRYLFVNLRPEVDAFAPIRSTSGVSSLVRFGNQYATVADDLIRNLKARSDPDGVYDLALKPLKPLKPGDRVRVMSGPLAEYECIVAAPSGRERVELLLQFVAREVKVSVPLAAVRYIGI